MSKYSNISIVASFFGLWLDSLLSKQFQITLGFFLILSFGILHGANDLLLIEKNNNSKNTFSFLKTLLYYVVVVLLSAILFYFFPGFALILFILVSAFHFGEQQWKELMGHYPIWIFNFIAFTNGIFILVLLFIFHTSEVETIIFEISKFKIPSFFIDSLFQIFGGILLVVNVYCYFRYNNMRKKILTEAFYLLVFAILFRSSSLIWGFSIYFIIWHSIPSILEQMKYLYGGFSFQKFKIYCQSAFLYWSASILGLLGLYFIFRDQIIFNAIFFSFLAAITFPHALVITKMFKK